MSMLSLRGAWLWRLPSWCFTGSCPTKPAPTCRQFAAGLPDSPARPRRRFGICFQQLPILALTLPHMGSSGHYGVGHTQSSGAKPVNWEDSVSPAGGSARWSCIRLSRDA